MNKVEFVFKPDADCSLLDLEWCKNCSNTTFRSGDTTVYHNVFTYVYLCVLTSPPPCDDTH